MEIELFNVEEKLNKDLLGTSIGYLYGAFIHTLENNFIYIILVGKLTLPLQYC